MTSGFSSPLLRQNPFLKTWKRHFYAIEGDSFVEFDLESRSEESRLRVTSSSRIERITKRSKAYTFQICLTMNCRPFVYAPDTEDLLTQWLAVLNEIKLLSEPRPAPTIKLGLTDFEIVSVIGRGTYGKVSLVRHRESGQLFAMKAMSKSLLVQGGNIQQILAERDVLLRNQHPFLVAAHFTFQTDSKIFLILDYVPGGELFHRLREEQRFIEPRARLITAELVLALGHLHKNGFIYRDLKPENVLFDEEGHVKLTDFGYTKSLPTDQMAFTFCGTADYLAPEILSNRGYTKSVDWWSLGCLLYEMLVSVSPFYNSNVKKMYKSILNDGIRFPQSVSPLAKDLISQLLKKDPGERLGSGVDDAKEIQGHSFFGEIDWKAVFERKVKAFWTPKMKSETDTSMFDRVFTAEEPVVSFEKPPLIPEGQNLFEDFTLNAESIVQGEAASCSP
jgi:serine/threonine protein kinase